MCDFVCRMFEDLGFQALLMKRARAEVGAWKRKQRLRAQMIQAFWAILVLAVAVAVFWMTGRARMDQVASSSAGTELEETLRRLKGKVG